MICFAYKSSFFDNWALKGSQKVKMIKKLLQHEWNLSPTFWLFKFISENSGWKRGVDSDAGRTFTQDKWQKNGAILPNFIYYVQISFSNPSSFSRVHHLSGKTLLVKTQAHTDEDSLCNEQISKIYALYCCYSYNDAFYRWKRFQKCAYTFEFEISAEQEMR